MGRGTHLRTLAFRRSAGITLDAANVFAIRVVSIDQQTIGQIG
jgi:hypothetical protein